MAEYLPDECLIEIFHFLSLKHRLNCQLVCRKWFYLVNSSLSKLIKLNFVKDLEWSTDGFQRYPHEGCENCDRDSIWCLNRHALLNKMAFLSTYTSKNLIHIIFDSDCRATVFITDEIISALQSFYPRLKSLCLKKCPIEDKAFTNLSGFTNLETLYFDGSSMISDSAKALDSLKFGLENFVKTSRTIMTLTVANIDISFKLTSSSLIELHLKKVSLNNFDLKYLCEHCPILKVLNFNQCYDLTDFSCLAYCTNLHSLSVLYCNITDYCLYDICSKCKSLERIRLELCPVKDYAMLATIKNLHTLHLGPSAFITFDALLDIFHNCPLTNLKLRQINIDQNLITNLIVVHCSKNIQRLSLIGIDINDNNLWQIISSCSSITHLSINRTQVTDNVFIRLAAAENISLNKFYFAKNYCKIKEKTLIAFALGRLLKSNREKLDIFDLRVKQIDDHFLKCLTIYHDLFFQARLKISDKLDDEFKFS